MSRLSILFRYYLGVAIGTWRIQGCSHVPSVAIGLNLYFFSVHFLCLYPELVSMRLVTRFEVHALPTRWNLSLKEGDKLWRYTKRLRVGRTLFVEEVRKAA